MSHLAKSNGLIPSHSYQLVRLEPVIGLTNGKGAVRHWELLCKNIPDDLEGWREFYSKLIEECNLFPLEIRFAFNVDSDHVMDEKVWASIQSIALHPQCIAIEWTETASSHNVDDVALRLVNLKSRSNIELHLDDVGSGDDPMSKASLIHPDVIKIDGELFHRARTSRSAASVISEHIRCYQVLHAESIIEWIESADDLALAVELGADYGQGYLFK